jgi:DNA-binding winged helix-turn-helix (wHTH) protein
MPEQAKQLYKFGEFELDVRKRLLWRNAALVPLAPKLAETLALLVEREGDVVDKQELLSRVWPDTVVEENSLSQNISALRRVLGPSPDGSQYIETVAKRGYRFVSGAPRTVAGNGDALTLPSPLLRETTNSVPNPLPDPNASDQSHYTFSFRISRRGVWILSAFLVAALVATGSIFIRESARKLPVAAAHSDLPIIGTHPKWYDFEDGSDGWISASGGMITQLTSSDAHSYKGRRSLGITFAGPFKPKTQVYVVEPAIPPGDFVLAEIWCPRENNLTSIAVFVEEGNGSWDNDWEPKAQIDFGSWTKFRLLLPTDAVTPLRRVGVEFTSHAAWRGTCYLDSVEWVPSW